MLFWLATTLLLTSGYCLQCLNDQGYLVDWFIVYKLPQIRADADPKIKEGSGFFYMDSTNPKFVLSSQTINGNKNPVSRTLKPLYSTQPPNYIMYNDQPPDASSSDTYGHLKGVLASDKTAGFWLMHSVPQFPPIVNNVNRYWYPHSGLRNGQIFLCMSFSSNTIQDILTHLAYSRPKNYESLTMTFPPFPAQQNVIHNNSFSSINGQNFSGYSKPRDVKIEIYEFIADEVQQNISAQTFLPGRGTPLPSSCNIYWVENIEKIKLDAFTFKSSKDHSKWAITSDVTTTNSWVCIGSLNRVKSQTERGGNALCFQHPGVHKQFHLAMSDRDKC